MIMDVVVEVVETVDGSGIVDVVDVMSVVDGLDVVESVDTSDVVELVKSVDSVDNVDVVDVVEVDTSELVMVEFVFVVSDCKTVAVFAVNPFETTPVAANGRISNASTSGRAILSDYRHL